VQTTNLLIVNQNLIDMLASLFMVLTALVQANGSEMNHDSALDQFVCRFWLTRFPLWSMMSSSTFSILVLSLDRYLAVVHPVFYKVRITYYHQMAFRVVQ
jgi:7 transmembrane receptor (rhodopsin family)